MNAKIGGLKVKVLIKQIKFLFSFQRIATLLIVGGDLGMNDEKINDMRIISALVGVLIQHNCSAAQAEQLCLKAMNTFKERSFHVSK